MLIRDEPRRVLVLLAVLLALTDGLFGAARRRCHEHGSLHQRGHPVADTLVASSFGLAAREIRPVVTASERRRAVNCADRSQAVPRSPSAATARSAPPGRLLPRAAAIAPIGLETRGHRAGRACRACATGSFGRRGRPATAAILERVRTPTRRSTSGATTPPVNRSTAGPVVASRPLQMDFRLLGPLEVLRSRAGADRGGQTTGAPRDPAPERQPHGLREQLIDALWGEERAGLGTEDGADPRVAAAEGASGAAAARAPGYLLEVGDDELDLSLFERSVPKPDRRSRRTTPEGEGAAGRRLALSRGPALAEFAEPFGRHEAARLSFASPQSNCGSRPSSRSGTNATSSAARDLRCCQPAARASSLPAPSPLSRWTAQALAAPRHSADARRGSGSSRR